MEPAVKQSPQPVTSYVVIPARLASTRLPRKLLLDRTGKPLIQHTYEAAQRAGRPMGVCIAADDRQLVDAVEQFGGNVRMTDPSAASGTDRVAELARGMPHVEVFVNVQGDEPEIEANAIDLVVSLLEENPDVDIATLATPINGVDELADPNCVKVICDHRDRALYFSRSPIPYARNDAPPVDLRPAIYRRHLGLYAYRRDALLRFASLTPSVAERIESLEQLRALHHGMSIMVGQVEHYGAGVDTLPDYEAFVLRMSHG